jgi:hypothetical protein
MTITQEQKSRLEAAQAHVTETERELDQAQRELQLFVSQNFERTATGLICQTTLTRDVLDEQLRALTEKVHSRQSAFHRALEVSAALKP